MKIKSTQPKPAFRTLTDDAVRNAAHALEREENDQDPIVQELARVLEIFADNASWHVQQTGEVPESFLQQTPETAIERKALSMMKTAIAAVEESLDEE